MPALPFSNWTSRQLEKLQCQCRRRRKTYPHSNNHTPIDILQSVIMFFMNDKHPLLVSRGYKPRKGKVLTCIFCSKEYYCMPCHLNHSICCSVACKNKSLEKEKVKLLCFVCKQEYQVHPSTAKWNKIRGHKQSTCSKECQNEYLTGSSNPTWIQDRTKLKCRPNGNTNHKKWRKAIFERDNYTCQFCGERGGYLEADHIKPWAFFPELRTFISNGRTLCKDCHNTTKRNANMMKKIYVSHS